MDNKHEDSKPAEDSRPFPVTTTSEPSSFMARTIAPLNASQFTFPLHPDHNNIIMQMGLHPPASLLQNQAPYNYCNRCGTMCSSAHALIQHQQLCCISAQSEYISSPMYNLQVNNSQNSIKPFSLPIAATPPATSLGSQMPAVAYSETANHIAKLRPYFKHLMSMGLGLGLPMHMNMGMNMNLPFAAKMNMHPTLIPLIKPTSMEPFIASTLDHSIMPGSATDPICFASQEQQIRTSINGDLLKILRANSSNYINNPCTEEKLLERPRKSGLSQKVEKDFSRSTLFRERQRSKDSPYNFKDPPPTYLNLEEHEKTGAAKITPLNVTKPNAPQNNIDSLHVVKKESIANSNKSEKIINMSEICVPKIKKEKNFTSDCQLKSEEPLHPKRCEPSIVQFSSNLASSAASNFFSVSEAMSSSDASSTRLPPLDCNSSKIDLIPPSFISPPTSGSNHWTVAPSDTLMTSSSSVKRDKRGTRTIFTEYEIKVLKEYFETDAYPEDNVLEYLSELLNFNRRVIIAWFNNARQKARKLYEKENAGRIQRTPGLSYQCKHCLQVFQRYYERIKHQKSSCFKCKIKVMSGEERSSPTPKVPTPTPPTTPFVPRANPEQQMVVSSNNNNQNGAYHCDKCSRSFGRFDLCREHQNMRTINPTLFSNFPLAPDFRLHDAIADKQTQAVRRQGISERPPPGQ